MDVSKGYGAKLTRKGKGNASLFKGFKVKGNGATVFARSADLYLADQDLAAAAYNSPDLIIPQARPGQSPTADQVDGSRNAYAAHLSPGHLTRTLARRK